MQILSLTSALSFDLFPRNPILKNSPTYIELKMGANVTKKMKKYHFSRRRRQYRQYVIFSDINSFSIRLDVEYSHVILLIDNNVCLHGYVVEYIFL